MQYLLFIVGFTFIISQPAQSQGEIIYLQNPSFEGVPAEGHLSGKMLDGWDNCGFSGESLPDVHPQVNSNFGVTTPPAHGKTYLGIVVRDNDTWERVGQKLSSPLLAGEQYKFTISLARSLKYESPSRRGRGMVVNFITPATIRIWGGHSSCDRKEKLAISETIMNSNWMDYTFILAPTENYDFLVFEAFYKVPSPFPYNGNILIDNASELVPVDSATAAKIVLESITPNEPGNRESPAMSDGGNRLTTDKDFARYEFSEPHMDTEFRIVLYADNELLATEAARDAFARLAKLEEIFSPFQADSEVNRLSAIAGTDQIMQVSIDLWKVLDFAQQTAARSKGTFDFTTGALAKIWRSAFRQQQWPGESEIREALATVGYKKVVLQNNQEIAIWQAGLRLNLAGISRSYMVDEALRVLKNRSCPRALVDGGGHIAVGEAPPGESGWKLKRKVRRENGHFTTEPVTLTNQALVTTGDTESELVHEGKRYIPTIDPRSGYVITEDEMVSVVAPTCLEANAWATAMSVEVDTKTYLRIKKQGMQVYFSE